MFRPPYGNSSTTLPSEGTCLSAQQQKQLSLSGTNLPGDLSIVASTDPKPRLRWTPELHDRFVDAVAQLGGADSKLSFPTLKKYISLYVIHPVLRLFS